MSLVTGTRLGPYEIDEPIGKGGMGEVYRARDTKLDREVAIKVLPEEFAQDNERLARFEREAKLLASLNHPNIASIYGFESGALVLELVEGPTLAERITEGPIRVEEALPIARQIAEALEAGHEAGVIHRDLKPANIKLKEDGMVKVLDYGLAKALEGDTAGGADSKLSQSPTLTRQGTQIGVILGTAAYMSPEQARGRELDKRSDIFSFGAVLYEMLSGKRAFSGEDGSDILASVIKLEPDWTALPHDLDPRIEKILRRCLEKGRKKRRRDIGDVRIEVEEALMSPEAGPEVQPSKRLVLGAGVVGLIAGIVVTALVMLSSVERPVTRLSVSADDLTLRSRHGIAISPDGRTLAFARNRQLHVRHLDRLETRELPGTDGARSLEFSADGQWIAFESDGLKKVLVNGGTPIEIISTARQQGISWVDDAIYYAERAPEGGRIIRISPNGGEPEVLLEPDDDERLLYPRLLPDGHTLILSVARAGQSNLFVESHSLETGERRVLVDGGSDARYLPSGHLVYRVGSALQAVRFDLDALQVVGSATTVVEDIAPVIAASDRGGAHYAVSDNGILVYLSGVARDSRLAWFDRQGESAPLALPPALYTGPTISPDGTRVAVAREDDIWVHDIGRGATSRLTFTADNSRAFWTPDGDSVVFASRRLGVDQVFRKPADGSDEAEQVTTSETDSYPNAIAPDGSLLVYRVVHPDNGTDVWTLELDGERKSRPFLQTEFNERGGDVSPDGRWLAYVSDESGQLEVYVQPFPNSGAKIVISTDGGASPVWSADGQELFYREGNRLMAVPVELGDELNVGTPASLFEASFATWVLIVNTFDVTKDGERFLLAETNNDSPGTLHVVLNWHEELLERLPVP